MLWFDCTASPVDLHSLVLRRNTVLSVPVVGHRCTVNLPSQKKMEMFIFKYKGCLRFTGQQRNEAENVSASVSSTSIDSLLAGALLVVLVVDQITSTVFMISDNGEGLIFAE